MAETPRVLASVLNFNSDGDAIATIECLLAQTWPALDVIVVDNASHDGSREAIEAAFPQLTVINTGANLGYCGGNNVALEYARANGYDAVVVANHDIRLAPDAIEKMTRAAMSGPDVGVVGAQEVDAVTGRNRVLGGRRYDFWWSRRVWIADPAELHLPPGPAPMAYVQGALVMLTRAALERGLRFNDDMFAYADEIELGFQAAAAGLAVLVEPNVAVQHRSRGTHFGATEGYLLQRNRWYLVRHHGTRLHRAVNFLLMTFVELPAKFALRSLQGHPRFARACVLGFIDGVRGHMGIGRVGHL